MRISRTVVLTAAATVAACSASPSPFEPSGPPGISLLAAPAVVAFGNPVRLSLTNSSSAVIIVRTCPLSLVRWNGFSWDLVDGQGSCAGIQDTLATGGTSNFVKEVDDAKGLYRAVIEIHILGTTSMAGVYSNTFNVTQ